MDKYSVLRSRLNSAFGVISFFPLISVLVTLMCVVLYSSASLVIDRLSLYSIAETVDYYVLFIVPQFFLPVLTVHVALLIPLLGSFKIKSCIKSEKVPLHYFILCIGMFPGISLAANMISYMISGLLSLIGVPVLDVMSSVPVPKTPVQIFFLFFVMAVLPAICEEFIYRGFLLRGVSEFGKAGAVFVSSFAFGMMHATIQQIPFAFLIGLFLSYITVRFKSIVLPVVLHFVNNAISCVFLVLQNYLNEETLIVIDALMSMSFIVSGLFCTVIFIFLSRHDRANAKLKDETSIYNCATEEEAPVVKEKVSFFKAVTHSWGFWLFTVVYLVYTASNVFLTAMPSGV